MDAELAAPPDDQLPLVRNAPPAEGEPREGPWPVINPDGWLPAAWGKYYNFWQLGYDPIPYGTSAVAEACIAAYAQTIAMCPGDHWRATPDGGRERITTSALSRMLRRPNDYQSRSDFVLNLVRQLYLHGNSYHLAMRNDRFEVASLHPFDPTSSAPVISPEGEIFYKLAGNNIIRPDPFLFGSRVFTEFGVYPARDVLHVKLEAEQSEPLKGIPPMRHAEAAIAAGNSIGRQLITFFGNMSRPSGVLSTDKTLTAQQITDLRTAWNQQASGLNAGGVPILTAGLKWDALSFSAKDAELAAAAKLTQDEIFMVYGVPPAILGMTDKATFSSTEALMQFWLSRGLGFAINHVEVAFDHFFGLRGYPDEWTEFDTSALLRVAYKDRIEALARGVQGGIFAPDEARNSENYPKVKGGFGEEPRVQQQVVPLSAWGQTQPSTPRPNAPPAPPPSAGEDDAGSEALAASLKRMVREIHERG